MPLEIQTVWKSIPTDTETEIIDFWITHKAISKESDAKQRLNEVVSLARTDSGKLIGICTAQRRVIPRLRQPMYYYRSFTAPDHRNTLAPLLLLRNARRVLEEYNTSITAPECIGVLIEEENRDISKKVNHAIWPSTKFVFIGYSQRGYVLRASYFKGARLTPLKSIANQ